MFLIDSKLRWYLDIYDEIIDKKSLEHILQYSKKSAKYSKKNVYSRRLEYIIISAFLLYFKIVEQVKEDTPELTITSTQTNKNRWSFWKQKCSLRLRSLARLVKISTEEF